MRALRRAWGLPIGLPAARWMLEVGAWFLRTETELVLKSRRVIPTRLVQSGFEFRFSGLAGRRARSLPALAPPPLIADQNAVPTAGNHAPLQDKTRWDPPPKSSGAPIPSSETGAPVILLY